MKAKVVGIVTSISWGFDIQRTDDSYSSRSITVADGDWFILDDGSDEDLLQAIVDAVVAAGAELSDFVISIDNEGIISLSLGSGQTALITWTSEALRDALGFDGASTELEPDAAASRVFLGGWYPNNAIVQDEPIREYIKSISRPIGGSPITHYYGVQTDHKFKWVFSGYFRVPYYSPEFHGLRDLWASHLGPGLVIRIYPDRSVATPFVRALNPNGWQSWILLDPTRITINPLSTSSYQVLVEEWIVSAAATDS